ncbi:MAG TPA: translocation/assembly module TamB domain-containing protein [Limnobacter sp.]|nr:translocation/assembly module TamB domain-containing protein [Limnobacter sp.]
MRKSLLGVLLVPIVLFALVLLAAAWLLGTHAGLQWAVAQGQSWLSTNTSQTLYVELQSGNVWKGFVAKSLRYQDGELVVGIERLALELDWRALAAGHVHIKRLSAKAVEVHPPASAEDEPPFELPERVDLPLSITLEHLLVEQIQVDGLVLQGLMAKAHLHNGEFDLEDLKFDAEGAALRSSATVQLERPYAIEGTLSVQRDSGSLMLNGELQATGSLQRMELLLRASGQDLKKPERNQSLDLQATVLPFDTAVIEKVTASAERFNPQQWFDAAPSALLNLEVRLEPNADFTASAGRIRVLNEAPVALQRGGIPVQSLLAEFSATLQNRRPQSLSMQLHELQLADARRKAGQVAGTANWQAPPKPANGGLNPGLAEGSIALDMALRGVDASVLVDLPSKLALQGRVQANKRGQIVTLQQVDLTNAEATLAGQGSVQLSAPMQADLKVSFSQINPAAYMVGNHPMLEGRLNGLLEFSGQLMPANRQPTGAVLPQGKLNVVVKNSKLGKAPFHLHANLEGSQQRLESLTLDLDVMGNTLLANGSYGGVLDSIKLDANLSKLKQLGKALGIPLDGTLMLTGDLRGQAASVIGQVQLQASQLRFGDAVQLAQVQGNFKLGSSANSPWQGDLVVSRLGAVGAAAPWLQTLTVKLDGTRSQHRLLAQFDSAQNRFSDSRVLRGEFGLQGGVQPLSKQNDSLAWQGAVNVLKVQGLWWPTRSAVLDGPAPLLLAPGLFELKDFVIKTEDGSTVRNTLLRVAEREIRVEGKAPKFLIPRLSPILGTQVSVEPNSLYTNINWRYVATPDRVDGHVDVNHVSGGLQVLEDSQIDVNITTFKADLDFNRENASLNVVIEADEFGQVTANLALPVQQDPVSKSWGIAANKKMQGAVAASFTELNWLGPMISGGVRTSGYGQVAMAIAGTVEKPDVTGRLFAMDLKVFQLDQGIRLEDGNVVVDFTTDHAQIDTLEFTVYNRQVPRRQIEALGPLIQGTGKITAQGRWNLSGQNGEVQVKADRVPLLQRPDRWLMTNASIRVKQPVQEGEALSIRGEVNALGAYVEMPESGPETLSDDVFIQGRSETLSAGIPVDFQLQANLGDKFYLNAEGLRTRLKGGMRLVMLEGVGGSGVRRSGRRLSATGTIEAVDGTYRAYGQDLTIDRGVVNFQGPLDNPGLNVRAVRKGLAVEAGVEVTGTAQRPKVRLISDPAVPDAEKLSWMIIGRGSNSADRDSTLLLTAAAAIFGDNDESTTRKIARGLGIDDLSLSTGSLTAADSRAVGSKVAIAPGADVSANVIGADDPLLSQRIISLGKRFSDRVYLSFDQSVTTAASILKLNYQYSRRLSFIARTGADNAVDVLYQFSFD